MSSEPAIRVQGVSKCYPVYDRPADRLKQFLLPRLQAAAGLKPGQHFREYWALRDIDFEVMPGEQLGIIGRNGAGKSTLLQVICGTLAPTTGTVETRGRVAALLELGAGFNPELTGHENIFLNGSVLGLGQAEIEAKYDAIVAFADIPGFIHQPVKHYSSGMYMRLAFAVAVHVEPEVLVVDEALSVGDEGFQRKCLGRMEALRSRGTTVLFVSHSAQTVIQLCSRAIWIEGGRVTLDSTPKVAIDAYHKSLGAAVPTLVREAAAQLENTLALSPAMIEYPACGARIVSATLRDEAGDSTARLEHGRRYRFAYRMRLDDELPRFRCGMLIKTKTGVEVAGAVIDADDNGTRLHGPGEIEVEFAFTCLLAAGRYFVNCGAMASIDGDELYVHRLVDAFEIEVIHSSRLNPGGVAPQGLVDLEFGGRIRESDRARPSP